ncbi:MAG: DEAD/DEAH box helicase family protein [Candidatus Latescibacteria bacterium]|nr:DEAD/DEAH box helicase family protein [Candidatus Latescibacterota bacterium]
MRLTFEDGTLLLRDCADNDPVPPPFVWDARVDHWRALALHYRESLEFLRASGITFENTAPRYRRLDLQLRAGPALHPYQTEALAAWKAAGCRGLVVLPTGSGKSRVGLEAIASVGRSTLVVAPTIDLMNQWYDLLCEFFATEVGLLGGGYHQVEELTVTTYDSAYLHLDRYGNRFGLLLFDEVHHLPGEVFSHAAQMALAPYRLGLTATLERADGRHALLPGLVGPLAYEQGIRQLSGAYLADYRVEHRQVDMVAEERAQYETAKAEYQAFLVEKNLKLGSAQGWRHFVQLSSRSPAGRRAMLAYRQHRRLALGTVAKLRVLEEILQAHPRERTLVFAGDNDTVYEISRRFLVPAITHLTPTKERRDLLLAFNRGEYLVLVTSKVLNEGVNIPDASVAVVLAGSATIREHVQRLGRILRRRPGKEAVLYEVVSRDTVEDQISRRRRRHPAYAEESADAAR